MLGAHIGRGSRKAHSHGRFDRGLDRSSCPSGVKDRYILSIDEERELVDHLIKNVYFFTWVPSSMLGIGTKVVIHRLAIHPFAKLVAQRKRKIGEEKKAAID